MVRIAPRIPFYRGSGGEVVSGGNCHGESPAKVRDYLAIGIHEIASISERRIERYVNSTLSSLPAFLVHEGGLSSGFMIAHDTTVALVTENKVLTQLSSLVGSISISSATEDHVSMEGFTARKALTAVKHVETVFAIEIRAACQYLDLLRSLRTTDALEAVHTLVRARTPTFDKDRVMKSGIDAVLDLSAVELAAPILMKLHIHGALKGIVSCRIPDISAAMSSKLSSRTQIMVTN